MIKEISIVRKMALLFSLAILLQSQAIAQWQLPKEIGNNIDAVAFSSAQESLVFFSGYTYKYVPMMEEDKYPAYPLSAINQFPDTWDYVDGSTLWSDTELLLFKGHEYLTFDVSSNSISGSGVWPGLPEEWNGALDAIVRWEENRIFFFLGEEYVVYNTATQTYEEPDLMLNWEGWPAEWNSGIAGATNINDGNVYFFRDGKYLAFDIANAQFSKVLAVSN